MASAQEQMLQLLENEELPYADDASAGQKRGSPFAMYARSQQRELTDEQALAAKENPLDVTESFNLLKANKPQYDTTTDDMLKEGFNKFKSIGTGVLTGTLAIPSDVISISSFLADSMKKYSFTAAQLAPALKLLDKKIGRKAFDEQITKLGLKSSADDPYQIAGEIFSPTGLLLGLPLKLVKASGLSTPISKVAQSSKQAFIDQTNMLTGKGPTGGNSMQLADGPNVTSASEETKKLIDKGDTSTDVAAGVLRGTQTSNDPNIPSLPSAAELANKPIINPTIIGTQTETGRKAEAIYDDLVKQGINDPTIIFKKTGGGYVGRDGKFRFDLDDRDAVLKKDPNNFKFDVDSDGNTLKTKTITLNNLLKYPSLYKEYFQKLNIEGRNFDALKNIKVVLNYADSTEELSGTTSRTMGFYSFNGDSIQLNMNNLIDPMKNAQQQSDSIMSTLIHEVQHAVQHRETFANGTSPFDTKNIILDVIDKDDLFFTERGIRNPDLKRDASGDIINVIEKPDLSSETMINNMNGSTIYLEAEGLALQIKNDLSTDKYISLGDQVVDDIINFSGDRKFEFLKNYEALLDSKNSLDLTKNNYAKYIKLENLSEREATMSVALDIFERIGNSRAQKAFGFKTKDDFLNFYFEELETMGDLQNFINKAYDKARVNINLSDDVLFKIEKDQKRRLKDNIAILNFKDRVDNEAMLMYSDEYGEMEARLVEQRYKRRQALLRDSNLYTDEEITEKMLDDTSDIFKEPDRFGRTTETLGGFKKSQQLNINSNTPSSSINASVQKLESTNVKLDNPALQKISKIAKIQDGPLGSRTKLDKDGLPENLLRDKKGKPLVLYYGDSGLEYDAATNSYKPSEIPGKLKNKFEPSGRTFDGILGLGRGFGKGKPIGNFVTPNPVFASGYAGKRGSVVPVYLIADKVTNIKVRSFLDIDRAGADAKRGEVFIGDVGFDSRSFSAKSREDSIKKYGTEQYTFNRGTQVFSALTGERLTNVPTINQNIRNKLLKLNQAEEDTLLKKMSPKEKLQYKAKKSYIEDLDDEYFIEDMFKLDRKGDITRNEKKRNLAKGGVTMYNQMEMFQDGGLKDEGGTIDPVSGNDVPSGSTQEEVRDDIPAQLSEGEFVFPADVVRFIGLEKLMMMRQEAKAGLQRMEEMGQMGNSDEATIPDDTPFDINDLEMEDDTVEMAQGGVIQAANGTFVNTAPNVMYNPSQFATGQNLPSQQNNPNAQPVSYNAPVYNPVPAGSYTPTYYNQLNQGNDNIATFENLVGNNYGQYDEMRKYTSESGLILNIPFKGGQPIYPIPEGYTFVDPEATKTEEVKTVTPTPRTTQVTQQQDDGGDGGDGGGGAVDLVGDPLSYSGIFSQDALDKTMRGYAGMQVGLFNMKDALSRGFKDQVNVNEITLNAARETLKSIKSGLRNPNVNLGTLDTDQRNGINERLERINNNIKTLVTDTNYDSDGKAISSTAVTLETLETRAKGLERQAKIAGFNMKTFNAMYPVAKKPSVTVKNPMAMRNYTKALANRAANIQIALQMETQNKVDTFKKEADKASTFDTMATLQQAQNEAIETTPYGVPDISPTDSNDSGDNPGMSGGDSGDTSGYTDDTGMGVGAKGGFFTKSKMTKQKPKKMKQGGLASRK